MPPIWSEGLSNHWTLRGSNPKRKAPLKAGRFLCFRLEISKATTNCWVTKRCGRWLLSTLKARETDCQLKYMNRSLIFSLASVEPIHLFGESLTAVTKLIYLCDTDSLFKVAIQLFKYNFGDINWFLGSDSILHDLDYIFERYLLLLVQSLEDNLYIVYNILPVYNLVNSTVHVDETFKVQLSLLSEDFFESLRPNGYVVHVEDHLESFFEFCER